MYFCTCNFVSVIIAAFIHFCYHFTFLSSHLCGIFNKTVFGKQVFLSFPA